MKLYIATTAAATIESLGRTAQRTNDSITLLLETMLGTHTGGHMLPKRQHQLAVLNLFLQINARSTAATWHGRASVLAAQTDAGPLKCSIQLP